MSNYNFQEKRGTAINMFLEQTHKQKQKETLLPAYNHMIKMV